tara:strand:+ start:758 stop:1258 length:501 start_codon:yes stop_codon:yes gene_type:complete
MFNNQYNILMDGESTHNIQFKSVFKKVTDDVLGFDDNRIAGFKKKNVANALGKVLPEKTESAVKGARKVGKGGLVNIAKDVKDSGGMPAPVSNLADAVKDSPASKVADAVKDVPAIKASESAPAMKAAKNTQGRAMKSAYDTFLRRGKKKGRVGTLLSGLVRPLGM